MTATTDHWGCPVTAEPDEIELLQRAIDDYVLMSPAIAGHLPALVDGGPMSKALAAMLLAQTHRPAMAARARELANSAAAQRGAVSSREQAHLDAAVAWSAGDLATTVDAFATVLAQHPTDVLALRASYLLLFNAGRVDEMLAAVAAVRPHWSGDLPLATYLDGMESFALEESGSYRRAEILGRQGVASEPTDLWAIHAVSHVLEMEARRDEGVAWLESHAEALGGGGFAGHLWWHWAIQLWALGRHGDALDLYDRGVYPGASEEGLDLSNAVALLARLESTGVDVGDRWAKLAGPMAVRIGQHTHPFNDTHFAFGLARAGAIDDAHHLVEGMRAWSEGDDTAAEVLRIVGLTVAEAMVAAGSGRWARAVELLEPVTDELWRLGGSHAQRFVYPIVLGMARGRAAASGAERVGEAPSDEALGIRAI
jgi:hypothetical protein